MAALQRTDNRRLFRENLEDISPLSNANPFDLNIIHYNAGNRIDLTDTPFVDDAIRRILGPAAYLQVQDEEEKEEELAAKTFKFYLDGGELAEMKRVIEKNSNAHENLRQIAAENEDRRERHRAEVIRQREVAEHQARVQAAAARAATETERKPANSGSSLSRSFNEGARFVGERIEDAKEFVGNTAAKAVDLASDFGEAALDTGKAAVRMGGNVINNAAEAASDVAESAGNAVSGVLSSGRNLFARFSPF